MSPLFHFLLHTIHSPLPFPAVYVILLSRCYCSAAAPPSLLLRRSHYRFSSAAATRLVLHSTRQSLLLFLISCCCCCHSASSSATAAQPPTSPRFFSSTTTPSFFLLIFNFLGPYTHTKTQHKSTALRPSPMVLRPILYSAIPHSVFGRLFSTTKSDQFSQLLLRHNPPPALETKLSLSLINSHSLLDTSTVLYVLRHTPANRSILLRFFVWAGQQPRYRHSAATYHTACDILRLSRDPDAVAALLDSYRENGTPVSIKTFKILFDLCRQADLFEQALSILRRMGEFGCRPDTSSYNAVLRLLVARGEDADLGERLLNDMMLSGLQPDMVTYVLMVKMFCNAGRFEDANALVGLMRVHGCEVNSVVYSALIDGACKSGKLDTASALLEQMERESDGCVAANVVTYTCLIQCLCEKGRVEEALGYFDRMEMKGCRPNRVTIAAVLNGLCSHGRVDDAYMLIERVVVGRSISSEDCYSSLVVSFLTSGKVDEAEKLTTEMLTRGIRPDGAARNYLVRHFCSRGEFLKGFCWVTEMWKTGLTFDSDVYTLLATGLCEGAHLIETVALVGGMLERNIKLESSIDALVELLNKYGKSELASKISRIGYS